MIKAGGKLIPISSQLTKQYRLLEINKLLFILNQRNKFALFK
jgi:hypothetical protein